MRNKILRKLLYSFSAINSSQDNTHDQKGVSKEYWTAHNVTSHYQFGTKEESLEYFHWRNDQYVNYIELMPVTGFDGKCVLDFGCGPGHDLIGFGTYSKCKRLVGIDVSPSSVAESRSRLDLHCINAEVAVVDDGVVELPFDDSTFDHIHSSGVLHHTMDPVSILKELKRVLKPGGSMNVMVYNYNSIWVHLYVAYQRTILEGLYQNEDMRDRFRHSTDGEDCPISNCYLQEEWISLCATAGLEAHYCDAAVSVFELSLLEKRFAAIMDRRLSSESRRFLKSLVFDKHGVPEYGGHHAGIDACYRLKKKVSQ